MGRDQQLQPSQVATGKRHPAGGQAVAGCRQGTVVRRQRRHRAPVETQPRHGVLLREHGRAGAGDDRDHLGVGVGQILVQPVRAHRRSQFVLRQHEQPAAERGRGRQIGEHTGLALAFPAHREPGHHLASTGLGAHLLAGEHGLPLRDDAQAAAEQVAHRVAGTGQAVRHHPLRQPAAVGRRWRRRLWFLPGGPLVGCGRGVCCGSVRFVGRLRRCIACHQPEGLSGQGQGEGTEIAALGLHGQGQHEHFAGRQGGGRHRIAGNDNLLAGGEEADLLGELLLEHRAQCAADNARHLGKGVGHLLGPGLRPDGALQFHLGQHDEQSTDADGVTKTHQHEPHARHLAVQADRDEQASGRCRLNGQGAGVSKPEHGRTQPERFADQRGHFLLDAVATGEQGLFEAFSVVHGTAPPAAGRGRRKGLRRAGALSLLRRGRRKDLGLSAGHGPVQPSLGTFRVMRVPLPGREWMSMEPRAGCRLALTAARPGTAAPVSSAPSGWRSSRAISWLVRA